MRRVQEEVLSDLKEVLERRNSEPTSRDATGTIRSRLWQICRETLSQTVNQAKQEWKKVCVSSLPSHKYSSFIKLLFITFSLFTSLHPQKHTNVVFVVPIVEQ